MATALDRKIDALGALPPDGRLWLEELESALGERDEGRIMAVMLWLHEMARRGLYLRDALTALQVLDVDAERVPGLYMSRAFRGLRVDILDAAHG